MDLSCSPIYSSVSPVSGFGFPFSFSSSDVTSGLGSSPNSLELSTILLLLFGSVEDVSSVITNVSVIQSWRWFMHLSPFESIFLFFIIVEIGVLELLGLLPINFTEFWQGEASGRKRRRRRKRTLEQEQHVSPAKQEIGTKLLTLYKKLDQNECGLRALCELQSKVKSERDEGRIPIRTRIQSMLSTLHSYADHETPNTSTSAKEKRKRSVDVSPTVHSAIKPYAEAVKIGSLSGAEWRNFQFEKRNVPFLDPYYYGNANVTRKGSESLCQKRYSNCPVTSDEIIEYIERIHFLKY